MVLKHILKGLTHFNIKTTLVLTILWFSKDLMKEKLLVILVIQMTQLNLNIFKMDLKLTSKTEAFDGL